jgi:plasmid maintenance system antidote protein VapI
MSVGEVAQYVDLSRGGFAKMLRAEVRISAQVIVKLAEIFGWDRAARWWWMQGKCDMYRAAVSLRKARRLLNEYDPSSMDGEEWERRVQEAWRDVEVDVDDDYEERHNPSVGVEPENIIDITMKEELEDAGLE